jgi:DNA-directed RNA polymerase subunit omega
MNAILVKKALEVVINPSVLINMVSKRVRQLNSGAGGKCRPMVGGVENLGAADIALLEIIGEKIGYEMPEVVALTRPSGKGRRRPLNWAKV